MAIREVDPALRSRLQGWMRAVLKRRSWSPEAWARECGEPPLAATSITRFLGDPQASIPSTQTLTRLGEAANEIPPLLPTRSDVSRHIPLISINFVAIQRERDFIAAARRKATRTIAVIDEVPEDAFGIELETDAMSARGLAKSDVLVVAPGPPVNDQVVAYINGAGVSAGLYTPPYIVPQATSAEHKPVLIEDVVVLGVVRQAIKRL